MTSYKSHHFRPMGATSWRPSHSYMGLWGRLIYKSLHVEIHFQRDSLICEDENTYLMFSPPQFLLFTFCCVQQSFKITTYSRSSGWKSEIPSPQQLHNCPSWGLVPFTESVRPSNRLSNATWDGFADCTEGQDWSGDIKTEGKRPGWSELVKSAS